MAKITIRPRPGALSELLKMKGLTQMDASSQTRVDRKTLTKIDRGEEVKLETLQQVANKLQVTEEHFRHPPAAEVTDNVDGPAPETIMLRKLDAARLEELLLAAERIEWHLNAQVRDDEAREFLVEFERAAENFRWDIGRYSARPGANSSLRDQLNRSKTADDIAARLVRLAEHRLALLGADHLFWEYSIGDQLLSEHYYSSNAVHLSVEPFGTQSRRVHKNIGTPPPLFAPDRETDVFVNGEKLPVGRAVR